MNIIKRIFCTHEWLMAINLDEIKNRDRFKIRCGKCGLKSWMTVTTYSVIDEPSQKGRCQKRKYPTKKEAQLVKNRCNKRHMKKKVTRVYSCPYCHMWHLTSKK